jgi:hypothetical protein
MVDDEKRVEGPTPSGGAYAIAYFLDAERRPVSKSQAVFVEIHEYDEDDALIQTTYGEIRR